MAWTIEWARKGSNRWQAEVGQPMTRRDGEAMLAMKRRIYSEVKWRLSLDSIANGR